MDTLKKAGGNWVDGENFFNREAELEALIERIREGRHTLLTAQRRMGKTSLIREGDYIPEKLMAIGLYPD